jgi:RND family efflux transporter MFP subunit
VEAEASAQGLRYSGTVQPDAEISLAFKVGGYVTSVAIQAGLDGRRRLLQTGDQVRRGEVLATVRQQDYRQATAELKAALEANRVNAAEAQLEYGRAERLLASGTIGQAEYDAVKAKHEAAAASAESTRARLASQRIALADTELRAPADAVVLARAVELGTLASPGTVAFRLADVRTIKVLFAVPDEIAAGLQLGTPVTISADALRGQSLPAAITKLAPQSDPSTRSYDVEATLRSARAPVMLGMVVSVLLPAPSGSHSSTVVVSLSAVLHRAAREGMPESFRAYVVQEEKGVAVARARELVLGDLVGNAVQVASGLLPGDRVVVQGASVIEDGQHVRVVP